MRGNALFFISLLMMCMVVCSCSDAPASNTAAPGFSLKDMAGSTVTLGSFKGTQNVLLFFWTTWCPYCLKDMKLLNNDYAVLEKDNIILLAVNAGESKAAVSRLVSNYNINYRVLLDETSAVVEDYHVRGVPTFVLIDKEGRVIYKGNAFPRDEIEELTGRR